LVNFFRRKLTWENRCRGDEEKRHEEAGK
jgi:hypothetical protein